MYILNILTLSSLRRTFDFTTWLQRGVLAVAFPAAYSESFDRALYTQTSTSIHSLIADPTKLNPRTTAHNLLGRAFGRSLATTLKIGRKFDQHNFGLSNARLFTQYQIYQKSLMKRKNIAAVFHFPCSSSSNILSSYTFETIVERTTCC